MARPKAGGEGLWRWVALFICLLAIPLFVRSTAFVPPMDKETEPQQTQPEIMAVAEAPVVTEAPTVQPEVSTPEPEAAGITFSDGTVTADISPVETLAAVMASTPEPTNPPGVWTYENSGIQVTITRNQQNDFVYFAADIQLTDPRQFSYAFAGEAYGGRDESLSDMAERHNPLIAINGDYYGFHTNGIIIRGGELFRKNKSSRHLMAVEENGDLTMLTDRSGKQGLVANELMDRNVLHTFEFGPVLVENGEAVTLKSAIVRVGDGYLEPRTAIGQLGPLHYLVIVVDGRQEGYSAGCDLPTLQKLFMDYGVQSAFNLDGGGSTTLWFDGSVINQPASGDERRVSDIVMFMRE